MKTIAAFAVAFGADAPEISVAPDKLKPTYCQNFPEDGTRC